MGEEKRLSEVSMAELIAEIGHNDGISGAKPPTFDATGDWESYLVDFYEFATYKGWDYSKMVKCLPLLLQGEAKAIYRTIPEGDRRQWKSLTDAIAQRLKRHDAPTFYTNQLANRRQRSNETVTAFGTEIERLVKRAYPISLKYTDEMREAQCVNFFLNGLKSELQNFMLRLDPKPTNLVDAIQEAKKEEQILSTVHDSKRAEVYGLEAACANQQMRAEIEELRQRVCAVQLRDKPRRRIRCFACGKWGHIAKDCRSAPASSGNSGAKSGQQQEEMKGERRAQGEGRGQRPQQPATSRPRRQPNYKINNVTASMHLPFLMAVFVIATLGAAAQYQICLPDRVDYLTSRPVEENCTVPPSEIATKVERARLFVPVSMPEFVDAFHCYNATTITCTKSKLLWRDVSSQLTVRKSVPVDECWRMVQKQKAPNGDELKAINDVEMATTRAVEPEYRVVGELCSPTTNFHLLKGRVGVRYGRRLISELDDLTNCNLTQVSCEQASGTTVWEPLPPNFLCTHQEVKEEQTILLSKKRLILESSHAGFYIASNQSADRAKACVPEDAVKLDGDAYLQLPPTPNSRRKRTATPEPRQARRWTTTTTTTTTTPATTTPTTTTTTTTAPRSTTTNPPSTSRATTVTAHSPAQSSPRSAQRWMTTRPTHAQVRVVSDVLLEKPWRINPWSTTTTPIPTTRTPSIGTLTPWRAEAGGHGKSGPTTQQTTNIELRVRQRAHKASTAEILALVKAGSIEEKRRRRTGDESQRQSEREDVDLKESLGIEDHRLNSVLNYMSIKLTENDKRRYDDLWVELCRLENHHIAAVNAWLSEENPTRGIRFWLGRDDVVARHRGNQIAIAICTQVMPRKVFWGHVAHGYCYANLPVEVEKRGGKRELMFVRPGTRDLYTWSPEVECGDVGNYTPLRQVNGTWQGLEGPVKFLAKRNKVGYRNHQNPLVFNSASIYGSEVAGLSAEVSLLTTYMHRIRRTESLAEALATVRSSTDAVEDAFKFIEQVGETAVNRTREAIDKAREGWTELSDRLLEYKWVIIVIAIPISLALCLTLVGPALPLLGTVTGATRLVANRRPEITAVEAHPSPSAPMLPNDPPVELLNYFPAVYCVFHQPKPGSQSIGKRVQLEITLNGTRVLALFDPGANKTYCQESLAKTLGLKSKPINEVADAANRSTIRFKAELEPVRVRVGNVEVDFSPWVSADGDCPRPLLMGTDLIHQIEPEGEISMNLKREYLRFGNGPNLPFIAYVECREEQAKVRLLRDECLEPRSDNIVMTYTSERLLDGQPVLVEPHPHSYDRLAVGKCLVQPKGGEFPVRVFNMSNTPLKLYAGSHIANMELVDDAGLRQVFVEPPATPCKSRTAANTKVTSKAEPRSKMRKSTTAWLCAVAAAGLCKLSGLINFDGCALSPPARQRLCDLIDTHQEAFVGSDGQIGCYKGRIEHRVDLLPGSTPFQMRPYRLSQPMKEEVRRHIEDLLRQKVIQPSSSEFASPIIMVPKKDGSWRFAVDFRRLNSLTRKPSYLLPLIPEIVETVATKKLFSCFDLASGFHQIPINPAHRQRTSFITFLGQFEYLRMPNGLCGAPHTFQLVMQDLKRHLTGTILIYIDDIILCSEDEDTHLAELEQLLGTLVKFGLKLRIDKCNFGRREIKYLGYLISENGVRVDPSYFSVVSNFSRPSTLRELRSLLGALSYFRKFIPNFAEIAHPLHELTRKEEVHEWGERHEAALSELKSRLLTSPVLAAPNYRQPFILETDASAIALGACLLQKGKDGREHPIAYISRTTSKHERNYHSLELEALAVLWAATEFRPYIEGMETEVRTDSSGVCSVLRRKDLSGRLARFQVRLQPYNLQFKHRSGKSNTFCDHLSRFPPSSNIETKPQVSNVDAAPPSPLDSNGSDYISRDDLEREQRDEFEELHNALAKGTWPSGKERREKLKRRAKGCTLNDGLIYSKDRLLIPYTLREKLVKGVHRSPLEGAHLGQEKIVSKLGSRVYWPGMTDDIRTIIASCAECQARKSNPAQLAREPMMPIPKPSQPFQHLHIDIVGPLPCTPTGQKYILSCVDAFSKYLAATPMADMTAITVAKGLLTEVICRFGVPIHVTSDQGTQFVGQLFKEMSLLLGVTLRSSAAYHQQANGQVEKANRTLADMLSSYANADGNNWHEYLQLVVFAYNTSLNATTRETPFFLNHGRHARLPLDSIIGRESSGDEVKIPDFKGQLTRRLERAWELARRQIDSAQRQQKADFDDRHRVKEHDMKIGDVVLCKKGVTAHKFADKWVGPYTVIGVERPNCVLRAQHVLKGESHKPLTVHMDRLKKFKPESPLPLRPFCSNSKAENNEEVAPDPSSPPTPSPSERLQQPTQPKRWERGVNLRRRK